MQLFFTFFISVNAQSNGFWLRGYVRDNFTDAGIDKAKMYLLSKDSVIMDSAQTRGDYFSFRVKRDKSFRSCIIKVTHPNYQTQYSTHSLKYVGKKTYFDIPIIYIKRKNTFTEQTLQEVVETATKSPQRGLISKAWG